MQEKHKGESKEKKNNNPLREAPLCARCSLCGHISFQWLHFMWDV